MTPTDFDPKFDVTVVQKLGAAPRLSAPRLAGLVTAFGCTPGEVITPGQGLIDVDGVKRVTYTGGKPLYRLIGKGARGDDILTLRAFLQGQGFWIDGANDAYAADLATAIGQYAEGLGLSRRTAEFDPAWLVWMQTESFRPLSCDVNVGDLIQGGDTLASGSAPLESLEIQAQRAIWPTGDLVLTVEGLEVPVEVGASGKLVVGQGFDLAAAGALPDQTEQTERGAAAGLNGVVRLATPKRVTIVPPSALISSSAANCLVVGPIERPSKIRVVVLDTTLAGAIVQPGQPAAVAIDGNVIVNAAQLIPAPVCD